jgi:hypothetical protein
MSAPAPVAKLKWKLADKFDFDTHADARILALRKGIKLEIFLKEDPKLDAAIQVPGGRSPNRWQHKVPKPGGKPFQPFISTPVEWSETDNPDSVRIVSGFREWAVRMFVAKWPEFARRNPRWQPGGVFPPSFFKKKVGSAPAEPQEGEELAKAFGTNIAEDKYPSWSFYDPGAAAAAGAEGGGPAAGGEAGGEGGAAPMAGGEDGGGAGGEHGGEAGGGGGDGSEAGAGGEGGMDGGENKEDQEYLEAAGQAFDPSAGRRGAAASGSGGAGEVKKPIKYQVSPRPIPVADFARDIVFEYNENHPNKRLFTTSSIFHKDNYNQLFGEWTVDPKTGKMKRPDGPGLMMDAVVLIFEGFTIMSGTTIKDEIQVLRFINLRPTGKEKTRGSDYSGPDSSSSSSWSSADRSRGGGGGGGAGRGGGGEYGGGVGAGAGAGAGEGGGGDGGGGGPPEGRFSEAGGGAARDDV